MLRPSLGSAKGGLLLKEKFWQGSLITSSSFDDLHVQLGTFVRTSKIVDTVEQGNEEEVQALFMATRESDAQDESFAKLDMDDETESENEKEE